MVDFQTTCSANAANRVSHFIRRKPAANLYHAIRIAKAIGLPLNVFVTVNLSELGIPPEEASKRFRFLLSNRFGPWVTRAPRHSQVRTCQSTYVWVLEAAGGVMAVHWVAHVPEERLADFQSRLPDWVESVTGGAPLAGAIHEKDHIEPRSLGKYLLKGMEEAFAPFYGVEHKPQGAIVGKRSGFSQNLGPSVKRRLIEEGAYKVRKPTAAATRAARYG
jgi:hypothetical protein